MYGVVDVDVDIVQKIVILVPVSAPFALKTLEMIINNRLRQKNYVKSFSSSYLIIPFTHGRYNLGVHNQDFQKGK